MPLRKFLLPTLLFCSQILFAQITIDADFESGNLLSYEVIDSLNFNVTTQADLGVDGGSTRWFYFRMAGVKDKDVTVNFTNTDITKAMYSYDNETFDRFTDEETFGYRMFNKNFEKDTVYLAYYTPYNYSYLQKRITDWSKNQFVSVDTLGTTPKDLQLLELIVTDKSVPDSLKKSVWIHARTHPSETPSSWQFDGIMEELLSNKEVINHYLKEIVFHMIPFTNPDGVFYGRSRVNYEGINLEPNWDKTEILTSKEVKILRARMKELNDEKPFSVFLNLHSQASSYCTFWIHNSSSTSNYFFRREMQFSNLNVSDNPYFNNSDYSFSSLRSVFPEGWLWNNYGDQVMALTYETPYNNYHKDSSSVEVTNNNLSQIGKRTVYALAEYLEISHPKHFVIDNLVAETTGDYTIYDIDTEFFGDDFLVLTGNGVENYSKFTSEDLPKGNYTLYAWWVTNPANSYETKFEISDALGYAESIKTQKLNGGQWNHLLSFKHNSDGPVEIKVNNNATGLVIADAFSLVYTSPITGITEINNPTEFKLYQNYPNPFNPTTTISYSIPFVETQHAVSVHLIIYDILGRRISTLIEGPQTSGMHEIQFNGTNLASGTYFYRLQVGDFVETKKMLLIK